MQVYLMRHGIAAERGTYADDTQRPLVAKGINKTRRVAERLAMLDIGFDTLLTSPLVRAVQTAEILCNAHIAQGYEVFLPLAPGGNIGYWLDSIKAPNNQTAQTIGLVGHEPDLSNWAQQLVHNDISDQWILKKAGVIGIEIPRADCAIGNSHLFWLAPPRFIL